MGRNEIDPVLQRGKYACLSHCWGLTEAITTTKDTYLDRTSGIQVYDLPPTFRDAVAAIRKLGLRYLWIDSLCIFQDDTDDWAREESRLADIYNGAHIVIAANRAADSQSGIFHMRNPRPYIYIPMSELSAPKDDHEQQGEGSEADELEMAQLLYSGSERPLSNGFDDAAEPLLKRAWALQERVLARRVLHFNSRQMYFECAEEIVSEDGFCDETRYCNVYASGLYLPGSETEDKLERRKNAAEGLLERPGAHLRHGEGSVWVQIVSGYGRRKLTKPTDKFPAMSGLARLLEPQHPPTRYVAGLWSNQLIEGLAWQGGPSRSSPPDQYIAPSWSWASYAGVSAMGLPNRFRELAKVENWFVVSKNDMNFYGEVVNAWIQIRGHVTELFPARRTEHTELEVKLKIAEVTPLPRMRTRYADLADDEGTIVKPNYFQDGERSNWKEGLKVFILGGYAIEEEAHDQEETLKADKNKQAADRQNASEGYDSFFGLIITDAKGQVAQDTRMKRVGWMFVDGDEGVRLIADEDNITTITLV